MRPQPRPRPYAHAVGACACLVGAAVALALAAATGVAIRQSLTLNDDELALAKQMGVSLQAVNPWTSEEAARCASEGLVKERGLDAVVASSDLVEL